MSVSLKAALPVMGNILGFISLGLGGINDLRLKQQRQGH